MNWRDSLFTAIRQGTYAKGAKAPSAEGPPDLLHLLHTNYPHPQSADTPDEQAHLLATDQSPERLKEPEPLEDVLKGQAIELWSDAAGSLFIVADEDDARRLGEPRGSVYTAAELGRVVQMKDPATVSEIHEWKRKFNARVREL